MSAERSPLGEPLASGAGGTPGGLEESGHAGGGQHGRDRTLLRIEGLSKRYHDGAPVLHAIDLAIEAGSFVAILGPSGAGKSTLLRSLNRLIEPTSGSIRVPRSVFLDEADGEADLLTLSPRMLRRWRRKVGMIFQQFNLIKRMTVMENVLSGTLGYQPLLPSAFRRFPLALREEAWHNLDRVGLVDQAFQRADTLSGGQQQRVAIARALMQHPALILADEPVASLDPRLSETILDLLQQIAREDGITVLVSLHVLSLARSYADRLVGLSGGRIAFDGKPETLGDEAMRAIYFEESPDAHAFI